MIWLILPHPTPHLPVSKLDQRQKRKTEKERHLADGREAGGVGGGDKSTKREKACPSINHLILSGRHAYRLLLNCEHEVLLKTCDPEINNVCKCMHRKPLPVCLGVLFRKYHHD
jgi:hypothetical protein